LRIVFRILDTDYQRAQRAETRLLSCLKTHRIEGRVGQVFEELEFSRLGLADLPALELNGIVLCQGQDLTKEFLDDVCDRLSRALQILEARDSSPKGQATPPESIDPARPDAIGRKSGNH